ncbi:MAG: hypothetical protein ACRDD4_05760, partial [Culicoidibacterales bacterium]
FNREKRSNNMKNIRMILVFLVAGVFILAGCQQSETTTTTTPSTTTPSTTTPSTTTPSTTTPSIDSQSGATSNY